MKYPLSKYKFFCHKDKDGREVVIAKATYAGKDVKGYAKCSLSDRPDFEKGKHLAAARCNEKIALKRLKRANMKIEEARDQVIESKRYYERMLKYFQDSQIEYGDAKEEVANLLKEM